MVYPRDTSVGSLRRTKEPTGKRTSRVLKRPEGEVGTHRGVTGVGPPGVSTFVHPKQRGNTVVGPTVALLFVFFRGPGIFKSTVVSTSTRHKGVRD